MSTSRFQRALAGLDLFSDPAPLTVPLLGVGLVVVGVGVWKLFQLYVRMDHRPARLRTKYRRVVAVIA